MITLPWLNLICYTIVICSAAAGIGGAAGWLAGWDHADREARARQAPGPLQDSALLREMELETLWAAGARKIGQLR